MLTTKALRWGVLTMTVALVFTACSWGSKNRPDKVAEKFLMAVQDMDFESARKYVSKKSLSVFDLMAKGMVGVDKPEQRQIRIGTVEDENNISVVTYYVTDDKGEELLNILTLIKEDGRWKVEYDGGLLFSDGINGSGAVAKKFFLALNEMDFEAAKQYATRESSIMLDLLSSLSEEPIDEDVEPEPFVVMHEQVDGNRSTVTFLNLDEDDEVSMSTIDLVLENGKWKVLFEKSSLMNEGEMEFDMDWNENE